LAMPPSSGIILHIIFGFIKFYKYPRVQDTSIGGSHHSSKQLPLISFRPLGNNSQISCSSVACHTSV
jgi:hypothetical protein